VVKGNKTRAEKFLREQIAIYEGKSNIFNIDLLFCDYVKIWLDDVKSTVDDVTFEGYEQLALSHVVPYFKEHNIRLNEITETVLQDYIDYKSKCGRLDNKGGLSAKSLRLHRNVLNQTLKLAVKNKLIKENPCQFVKFPALKRREPSFYSAEQIENLLNCVRDDNLYLLIKIAATYGLRRSEVLGLQWNSINFENNSIQIAHTVVKLNTTVRKDKTKSASSYRSFPLISEIKELLIAERKRQEKNKKEFKTAYVNSPYVFVWDDGKPFSTEYVSQHFKRLLEWNNLPHIRFHDLRHSCASILLSKGFTLKDVQEWLGHSDITLTANIYGHLDIQRKKAIAESIATAF